MQKEYKDYTDVLEEVIAQLCEATSVEAESITEETSISSLFSAEEMSVVDAMDLSDFLTQVESSFGDKVSDAIDNLLESGNGEIETVQQLAEFICKELDINVNAPILESTNTEADQTFVGRTAAKMKAIPATRRK